jgi:hypothetical protein
MAAMGLTSSAGVGKYPATAMLPILATGSLLLEFIERHDELRQALSVVEQLRDDVLIIVRARVVLKTSRESDDLLPEFLRVHHFLLFGAAMNLGRTGSGSGASTAFFL